MRTARPRLDVISSLLFRSTFFFLGRFSGFVPGQWHRSHILVARGDSKMLVRMANWKCYPCQKRKSATSGNLFPFILNLVIRPWDYEAGKPSCDMGRCIKQYRSFVNNQFVFRNGSRCLRTQSFLTSYNLRNGGLRIAIVRAGTYRKGAEN